ncbi:MAG: CDP-alcohol phosphatidyltransferase family protein [Alphaproteobacteria bacterium]|nr:CDP-alcohol phosphatidyltransferase family protein [Alphaproteobacteria bacterium]
MILPNLISLARLGATPVAVWLIIAEHDRAAFFVVLAAGLSDALDGALARSLGGVTRLGSLIDPVADKMLLVGVYVALGVREALPWWLIGLVLARDILILGGAAIMYAKPGRGPARPLPISKLNTAVQVGLVVAVLASLGLGLEGGRWVAAGVWLVAATTLASGVGYGLRVARMGRRP